jgi:filamentous hemagglutinin family protein
MNRHGSMNRIYRLVWSAVRNVWIPVAETARGRGKRSTPKLVAAALSLTCAVAQGSPTGGQVVAGTGSITQSGATTTITQATQNLSLTWSNFNIAPQQTVNFVQPSTSAIAVNRILGTNGTQILGYLHSNGQVFLINPNGIVFGPTAEVNVGGLVASALDLAADTSSSTKSFSGTGSGSVVNQGTITASDGGYVVLLGNHVSNEGVISAQLGTVALGAGSAITLTLDSDSRVHLQVDQSVLNSLAQNGGLMRADGGQVIMSAGAKEALLASVVNNTGVIEARTVDTHDGTITLLGGMMAGTVKVAGTLDASAPNGGNGGEINTSAAHVEVAGGARVTTAARDGLFGSWLIDPQDYTVTATGGDITGTTLSNNLGTTDITLQSSAGATPGSGNVNVDDAVTWSANTTLTLTASNNVNVNANITASGNNAGLIINPNTANTTGSSVETPTGTGTFNLAGASITLSGTTPHLSIAGTTYTVINTLGMPGSVSATDLQGLNGNLAGDYALGSNIDASATSVWNSSAGFTPIGTSATPFVGTFDGLGHTITNLTSNLPTTNQVGLFGYIGPGSLVQNIGLVGGSVAGRTFVAGLVGWSYEGSIKNSYVTGSVTGTSLYIGGLVGLNDRGTISDSYATGSVGGAHNSIGGLVGYNFYGSIVNSYATGSVSGAFDIGGLAGSNFGGSISNSHASGSVSGSRAGGLVGESEDVAATIANSYATGAVNGSIDLGGLVGFAGYSAISNSYATGRVSGTLNVGGLVGYTDGAVISNSYSIGTVSDTSSSSGGLIGINQGDIIGASYWNTTTNPTLSGVGSGSSIGVTGLSTAQMQTVAGFSGFAFTATPGATDNNWVIVDTDGTLNNANGVLGATFPMLASEYSTVITNAHQLQLIAMALSANYTLAANVNAAGTDTSTIIGDVWSTSGGFVPIGTGSASFSGSFDGLGHTISGLTMNLPAASNVGLFGSTSSAAVVQNVGLVGSSVYGSINVGGLIGINEGAVRNSYATGSVAGFAKIGGLVGFNNGGAISSSHTGGQVNGNNYVGGMVGYNQNAAISNSYSTATAGGLGYGSGYNIGGLLGYNYHGTINNSFATGAISGAVNVGGLVGGSYASATNSSHATGTVTEPAYMLDETGREGGLVGFNYGGSTITNSYATGMVTGAETVGGLVGENGLNAENGVITNSYATGRVIGAGSRGAYGYGNVGGLVGLNYGAITTSYATGSVNSTGWTVGGLVGMNAGSITNSHAGIGSVTGTGSDVGGLVGNDYTGNDHTGTVANSYATGNVTGGSSVGGLVGAGYGAISNSHAAGNVTSSGSNVGGLEGSNDGAPISNSYASGNVTGASNVGGLAGQSGGVITNSYATGSVTGTGFFVGGLVGSQYGSIIDSHATGDVTGVRNVGGLVGYDNPGAVVTGSYATGAIQGTFSVGGLIGINYGGAISSSHASGTVTGITGSSSVGGLVGFNYRNAPITDSYATGTVSGSSYVGGFVGNNDGGVISNSYATGGVSGGGLDSGGLVGLNDGTISNSYATGRVAGAGNGVGGLVGSNQGQGTVTGSFWNSDIDAIGIGAGTSTGAQGLSSGGIMTMSNFSSAGWNIADSGGSGDVWRIYAGNTAPLLASFLTPLTVTAENAAHAYTGTPVTGLTNANYSVTGAATSGHLYNLNNPYNGAVNVGVYDADLYSDQQGYDISYVNAQLTLTPATLTVTATGASRAYGQANPLLSGSVTGFVGGDTLASATTGSEIYSTAATASSNVGNYAITGAGLTANNGNYVLSFAAANASAFTIIPATLTVSGEVAASRIYNGTTDTTLTGGTLTGMVAGDTVTLTQAGHFTSPDAGAGVPVTATDALVGAGAGNYVLAEPTDMTANITPATLTYTAATASFTAGQTPLGLSGALTGFVAGETQLTATTGSLAWITTAGAASAPGRYAIDGGGLTATNYVFVDAAANATALTLLTATEAPVNDQSVVTSIEANLPSSQTNIQLAMLDISTNIAATQSSDVDTDVATEPTDSSVLDKRSVHRAMVPSLHVVHGGVKLPDNTVDISLR